MLIVKLALAFAALTLVPSEGAENRAATGLASKVAGLLRGNAMCTLYGETCFDDDDCCSGRCVNYARGMFGKVRLANQRSMCDFMP